MTKKASKRLLPFTCWADVESADDVRGFRERFFLQDWDTARATRVLLKSYPLEGGDPEKRHIIELNFNGGDSVRVQATLLNAPYPQNQCSSWTCNPHPVLLLHCFLGRAKDGVVLDGDTPAKMTSVSPCFHLDPSPITPAAPLPAIELNRLSSAQQRRLHAALEMQHCAARTDQLYGVATRSAQQRLQRDLEIERSLASKFTMPRMDGDCCAPALDMRQGDMCVCAGECNATCDVFSATWFSHYKQLLTLQEADDAQPGSRDKRARAERASKAIRRSSEAVAQRLLAHWLQDNPSLAPQQVPGYADMSAPYTRQLPLQSAASWQEVPLAVRADVQALVMHPGVLALADVVAQNGSSACASAFLPNQL